MLWTVSCNIGMTCVTTQTVGLNLQHWYDLCYNTNIELFLATLVWLVLQHKQLGYNTNWIVFLATLVHWYDLCYNTNSCFELFLATLWWLVLQHKQLLWNVSCNIDMTCVTTQTVGLNYFLQHWDDLCYNTNSCFELFLATLGWLVLQHKQLFWNVSYNIGMTCVTPQTVGRNCFLQHWYDLCYNTHSCFEMFLATLVCLVLQHKQLLRNVSCNIGMTCVTTQTVVLKCFFQHWYGLCYNTNSWSELFLATLGWLVLQHKQLVWIVSFKIWYDLCYNTNSWSELFLATLIWLVLQHKQLLWTVSCNIGMTCVTTQSVALKWFLQHWYDLCYNTNSWSELFLATLGWFVIQHKQLLWTVSCNIGMTCVTTQTVVLKCFLQHWYDLCYNINSALNCFLQHWYDLCYNTNIWSELFLTTLVWLVLQHKQLVWIVSYNIGMTCVTTQTVALNCFLQHWYDLCYNTNNWSELFLATLVWFVLQHKQLLWNISCNIGMTCVTTQTVALNCFLQHWYDLCYNTNSCFEMFLSTLVWLVLQHKQLLWNVSCNIGMNCVTTQTVGSELLSCNNGMACVTT